jgi:hypothetical protein
MTDLDTLLTKLRKASQTMGTFGRGDSAPQDEYKPAMTGGERDYLVFLLERERHVRAQTQEPVATAVTKPTGCDPCSWPECGCQGRAAPSEPQAARSAGESADAFEAWFLKFSSWGLTHEQLVRASFCTPGSDTGDVVYTSPSGNVMTRHICSHWINFHGAAQAGWNARSNINSAPQAPAPRSYADLSDSATTFDPERQYDQDRADEGR